VSRTFTPQASNLALSLESPLGADLSPETATNYEIGNKLGLFGQRLALTAALFQLNLQHMVNTDPNDPTRLLQTGAQRNRGFEFSAIGNLTPKWSIAANYAYLDARITHATKKAPAGALAGLVPRNQVSLWTRYAIDNHWGVGGGVLARSRVFTSFDNEVILPGYAVAGAMAYYQYGNYRIQLNVKNLFDRRYYATANGDNQIMPGAPRRAMLRVSLAF
jgi:catecholate siderophore receptor